MVYPVGSIYTNASNSANPATLLGFGTWEAFGAGRVMVGKASSGTFQTAGATGGAETHTLAISEMPSHQHKFLLKDGGGTQTSGIDYVTGISTGGMFGGGYAEYVGGGNSHNNLQPYIVVYMWKRTA